MTKKFILAVAVVVLAICLISGGCSPPDSDKLESWRNMLKLPEDSQLEPDSKAENNKEQPSNENKSEPLAGASVGQVEIDLYFVKADGSGLAVESRNINRTEAIGRATVEELVKGPQTAEYLKSFPEGTQLLDINVKPSGLCIVDLSSEVNKIDNEHQAKLMVYSLVNTLAQFPTINSVSILINGSQGDELAEYIDLSKPLTPDYNL